MFPTERQTEQVFRELHRPVLSVICLIEGFEFQRDLNVSYHSNDTDVVLCDLFNFLIQI